MSVLRTSAGALVGAATAGLALRVRVASRRRRQPIGDVISDLPGILAEDATRVADAARLAAEDGRRAAQAARIRFDEQVEHGTRRTKENDV